MPGLRQIIMEFICIVLTFFSSMFPSLFGTHQCDFCAPVCKHVGGTATCISRSICDLCGKEYGNFAEHIPGEEQTENIIKVTCGKKGSYDTVVYCVVCVGEVSRKTTTVEKIGHSWSEEVVKSPTCTQDGYITRTCGTCGTSITEIVKDSALGHNFGDWETVNSATCEADGLEKRVCGRCYDEETKVLAKTGHDYDEGVITTEPTYTANGEKTYTCKNDASHIYTEEVPALGHTEETIPVVDATCEGTGLTE